MNAQSAKQRAVKARKMSEHETRLRYGFLHNHHRLIKQLDLDSLLPHLIAKGLISVNQKELIKNEPTSYQATDKLLTILHRRFNTDPTVLQRFLKLLADPDIVAGQNLAPLVRRIRHDSESDAVSSQYHYRDGVLVEDHNATLREHEGDIVNSLSVGEVLPELVAKGVVSAQENDDIRRDSTTTGQARHLLGIVERRGSKAYSQFVGVLKESETYSHLGQLLESGPGGVMNDEKYVEEMLIQGHVPPRPKVYLERKALTDNIRTQLQKLKEGDRWLVVHGMAGFGKTVLAADAIRDPNLLKTVFPGGVNWLTVGQMTDQNGDVDNAKLLTKLQNIILRLDEMKNYRPPSVEAATDYLQEVISKQHPNSLLILDDVWSAEVAAAFSVRCRVMVTSRNAAVAERVTAAEVYDVSVSQGLNEDDAKELLAQLLRTKASSLSPHVDKECVDTIVKYCRGSPMAIALIGAILKRNNTETRWKQIAERLKKGFLMHAKTKNTSEQNYSTLEESIKLSVESLPGHLKQYFEILVTVDYDTHITRQALDTIWGTEIFDTEDYMRELIGYSLAQYGTPGQDDCDMQLYQIHDLVLDYLKDSTPKEKQTQLHQLVVKRYGDKCNGAYAKLEDDKYVFQKFMTHLAAAGYYELLGDLMTQLRWLMSMVQYGDANTYLANYRHYRSTIPEQFQTSARQFEMFLSGHMFVLANEATVDDILQLALLLPNSSAVYEQATAMTTASVGRKRSWFRWSNKWSDPEKYALKLKLHHDGVASCTFSPDESKVLSCAGYEVKLWDATTGMVLADYKGHTDDVTCSDLAPSGKYVVSCSEDCTVKVWDSRKKTVLVNFKQHLFGVQCCALSPDETLVLSADVDSVIMVWSVRTGKVQSKWRISALSPAVTPGREVLMDFSTPPLRTNTQDSQGGGEGVESCAFSPGGENIITSSQNGAVRMWNLSGRMLGLFSGHTGHVRCCVFSRDGDLLATASLDKTAKVWNVLTQECDVTIDNEAAILSCDFSPDGSRLLTGDTEGSVKVWSLPQGRLLQDYPAHTDFVSCVLYSPRSKFILSAADNGLIKIMWMTDYEEDEPEPSQTTPLYHRRFSVYFRRSGSEFEPIIVCYATKERKLQVVVGVDAEVVLPCLPIASGVTPRSWVISNDGSLIAIGYEEGMVQVLSLKETVSGSWESKEVWRKDHTHSNSPIVKIYFSPKNNKFITCSKISHKVWLAQEGRELSSCDGRGLGVCPCVFFKDSVRAVSAMERSVQVWNTNTGATLSTFSNTITSEHSILCVALSVDNKRLAASATNGAVMVWDVVSEALIYLTDLPSDPLSSCARSCALSPDGSLVAAGFDDGSLQIWNVNKCKPVKQCPTESDYWLIDLAFSPDGSTIVTLSDSIEWWRIDGSHAKRVMLKGTFGKYIRFSSDFMTFITIDNAGLLYIFTTLLQD